MRLAESREHLDIPGPRHRGNLADHTVLPMPGDPTTPTTALWPSIARSSSPPRPTSPSADPPDSTQHAPRRDARAHPQQPAGGHRFVGTLDRTSSDSPRVAAPSTSRAVDALSITPPGGATDSIRCAIPTARQPRCTQSARTDLTGDHPTGVQAHPQPQIHTVAPADLDAKPFRRLLNGHGGQAGTDA